MQACQVGGDVLIRAGALLLLRHVGHILLMRDEAIGDPAGFVRLHHEVVAWRGSRDVARKLVAVRHSLAPVLLHAKGVPQGADAQVEHLAHIQHETKTAHHVHDQEKDGLLSGPGDETIHSVRAGEPAAHVRRADPKAVEEVLACQERNFKDSS